MGSREVLVYGPGGYDESKPNNNLVSSETITVPDDPLLPPVLDLAGGVPGDLLAISAGAGMVVRPVAPIGAEEAACGYNDTGTITTASKTGVGTFWIDVPRCIVAVFADPRPQYLEAQTGGQQTVHTSAVGGIAWARIVERVGTVDTQRALGKFTLPGVVGREVVPIIPRRRLGVVTGAPRVFQLQIGTQVTSGTAAWRADNSADGFPSFLLASKK